MRTSSPAAAASCAATASASRPGTVRTSRPAFARSGTELMLIPPDTVPTFSVGVAEQRVRVGQSNAKPSRRVIARASLWIAFSPRCGIEPCAVRPSASASSQTTPLCATHG